MTNLPHFIMGMLGGYAIASGVSALSSQPGSTLKRSLQWRTAFPRIPLIAGAAMLAGAIVVGLGDEGGDALRSLSRPLSKVLGPPLLLAALGCWLGFGLVGLKSRMSAIGTERTGTSKTPYWQSAVIAVMDPSILAPIVLAVLMAGTVRSVSSSLLSVEFESLTHAEARAINVNASNERLQLRDTLLQAGDVDRDIQRSRRMLMAIYPGTAFPAIEASAQFEQLVVTPLFARIALLVRAKGVDIETVRAETRPLVLAQRRLLRSNDSEIAIAQAEFAKEYVRAMEALARIGAHVGVDAPAGVEWIKGKLPARVLSGGRGTTPWAFVDLALLSLFNGDIDGALRVLSDSAQADGDEDGQRREIASVSLAVDELRTLLMFYAGQDAERIAEAMQHLLDKLRNLEMRGERAGLPFEAREFRERRVVEASNWAYFAAQSDASRLGALAVARTAYESNPLNAYMVDNYAYVKMLVAARASPPSWDDIEQAMDLFQEAERLSENIADEVRRQANLMVIKGHLQQAEHLLQQRR